MKKLFIFLLSITLLITLINFQYISKIKIGDKAPNFAFTNLKDKTFQLNDFKGNIVLLDFWASWCAPCIKEMKSLNELKNNFSRVKILSVSQDADLNDAKKFFGKNSNIVNPKIIDIKNINNWIDNNLYLGN